MNIKANFFNALYKKDPDPWGFASNPYELNRYQHICEIVNHKKHQHIFEAGCSIGILTEKLAALGEFVEAIDISSIAIAKAFTRCNHLKNVKITCCTLKNHHINSQTDLIILSEIGYYFTIEEWNGIILNVINTCPHPFYLLASHWVGTSEDHLISGDEVHAVIHSQKGLTLQHSARNHNYRLDYWVKK